MRFIYANVFLYAILKARRPLSVEEAARKANAVKVYKRVNKGEVVMTSVVHLSEVANVLEDAVGLDFSADWIEAISRKANVMVGGVTREQYLVASLQAKASKVSVNDSVAYILMNERNLKEIYSFDMHLDRLGVTRVEG